MDDTLSGEKVVYAYDALTRLTSAAANPNPGSTPAAWTEAFQYDGFGNMTGKTLNGTFASIAVDSGINRYSYSGAGYDNNGNLTAGGSYVYDGRNRWVGETWPSGAFFFYDPDNHLIWDGNAGPSYNRGVFTLYGAYGEKLGTYGFVGPWAAASGGPTLYDVAVYSTNVWFAGRIVSGDATIMRDRVGTDRSAGARYRPYGDEITSTSSGRVKFGGYFNGSYADQRYYDSYGGRFLTADPYQVSAGPEDPGSWNRYSYTAGDPVNRNDRRGLMFEECAGIEDDCDGGGYGGDGGYGPCMSMFDDPSFCNGGDPGSPPVLPPETPAPPPCEEQETEYLTTYLSKYNSPLANFAGLIVQAADAAGIDDRFIVALAGAESQHGKTQQQSPTWGKYNAFSNASHCKALSSTSDCYAINPYGNYGQAIHGVTNLVTGSKYFGSGLKTAGAIYSLYNKIPTGDYLATIYAQLVPGATVNSGVDFSRCLP